MATLNGGTTIAGYEALHMGNIDENNIATTNGSINTANNLGNAITVSDYNSLNPTVVAQGNITSIKASNTANSPWNNTTSGLLIQSNDSDSFHIIIFRSGGDGWAYRSWYQGAWDSWQTYTQSGFGGAGEDIKTLSAPDLNTIKTTGNYLTTNVSTNAPTTTWGHLEVFARSVDRILQIFKPDTSNKIYYRQLTGSTWSSWVSLANISDITNNTQDTSTQPTNQINGGVWLKPV